ncbi:DUF559 domain-containing protein [Antrihabitans sp. NCIMB 15449]|uniref:DUF559 domain-containing protein n=1 Tax=Antrihabitans spumae TaxID=3373370 RepID=A0ABW7JSD5_9NOCA
MNPFGIRTREDLLREGVASSTIDNRVRQGVYHRLLPKIYSLGTPTALGRCAAILLWAPDATLSHRTAAWMWGMLPEPTVFEATVPPVQVRTTPNWLSIYRRQLRPELIGESWAMPTVEPARALFDCLTVLSNDAADRLIDEQLGRKVDANRLLELCELDCGLTGAPEVRRQLTAAAQWAASEPERMFARALTAGHCPLPANRSVGPYLCDFVDERSKLVVEIDGREFHSEAAVFRNDRRRQNWLLLEGWLVLRYAAYDVYNHLDEIADEVADVVRRRRRAKATSRSHAT